MSRYVKSKGRYAEVNFVSWDKGDIFASEASNAEDLFETMSVYDLMIFKDLPPDGFKTIGDFTYHHIS